MIGYDLQEVKEIKNPQKLLEKIALESEVAYIQKFKCNFQERVASLWSVKEAVFKALDVSEGDISYNEIELCHKENGAPFVRLYGKAKSRFESLNAKKIELSISHQKNVVGCVVVIF